VFDLSGKTAVITGAAAGIGKAIAERFHAAGAGVALVDRRDGVALAERLGGLFIEADVSREAGIERMLASARAHFGKIDILVNNAGIQPLGVRFDDLTEQLFNRTFAVNVNSVAFGIKHAGRILEGGGRVINTASFVGLIGIPLGAAYAASKAAVIHLTRLGAIELAPRGITVNAVCPGTVRTPAVTDLPGNPEIAFIERATLLGRIAEPEEIAALFHYLASPEAAYVTGQAFAIDGGITAGWKEYALVAPSNIRDGCWQDDG
jgi:NAD(P)-dependent dehydrogenase (short-subunit alcohol dehydrogenase family)